MVLKYHKDVCYYLRENCYVSKSLKVSDIMNQKWFSKKKGKINTVEWKLGHNICLQNTERKCEVAENGNIHVKYHRIVFN